MEYRIQPNKLDCGVSVIQMIYRFYFSKWLSLNQIRNVVNVDQNGINVFELNKGLNYFGIETSTYKCSFDSLLNLKKKLPLIVMVKNENYLHYVVLEKIITKKFLIIIDPSLGKRKINFSDFEKIFANIVIFLSKSKKTKNEILENKTEIKLFDVNFKNKKIMYSIFNIFVVLFSIIGSFYLKIVIDKIVPSNQFNELLIVSIMFIGLSIMRLLISSLIQFYFERIEVKLQVDYINKYIEKISCVKWERIIDIDESLHLKNIELSNVIASFQAKYIFNLSSNVFCVLTSIIMLVMIDVKIFLISIMAIALIVLVNSLFQNKFKSLEIESIKTSLIFKKRYLNIINGLEDFKLNLIQKKSILQFNESTENIVAFDKKLANTSIIYELFLQIIKNLTPFIIIILAIHDVWLNHLTIGQIFLFLFIFNIFLEACQSLSSMIIKIPNIKHSIDILNDFYLKEDEDFFSLNKKIKKISYVKLKDLNFQYSNSYKRIIVPELIIDTNIHLLGRNGSGKTTLLKLISTLIVNENIYYNNNNLHYYCLSSLREQICYLSNKTYVSSGNVFEFLSSNIEKNKQYLIDNINQYNLVELLEKMNLSLNYTIEENCKNLSSGQKQLIIILKVFSQNYSLILLDEVFENIDQEIMKIIIPILKEYLKGKIVIEVSHQENYIFQDGKEVNCESFLQ